MKNRTLCVLITAMLAALASPQAQEAAGTESGQEQQFPPPPPPAAANSRIVVVIDIPANLVSAYSDVRIGGGKIGSFATFASTNGEATTEVETFVVSSAILVRGSEAGTIDALVGRGGGVLRVVAQKKRAIGAVRVIAVITLNGS